MTREEAIRRLGGILTEAVEFENSVCYVTEEDREPLEMAIKALEQEPKIVSIAEIKFDDDMLHEIVEEAVKNIEIEPKWIPVSERLPEKNMACLVAVGKYNLTQMAMYSDLMGTIDHRIFYQGDMGYDNFENITQYVKAWMPLPKPYEPQEVEGITPTVINDGSDMLSAEEIDNLLQFLAEAESEEV